ncbi:S-locus-specific glycoprotein S6-like [Cryptomeria japonica]|uniref:S-locus-specific glycoprotein S6-like n=1 Tax=Cryptomeria japonica TaxID=3369 RepID=UPI0025AC3EC1|nr:S-locus-specific glycoprotein S6-like [Cryptomeria japonica]
MAMKCFILAVTMMIAVNICSSLALGGGDSLLLGESLAGKRSIISNNGMFELGFFSPRGTSNWYIGIWYARISPKVIVWVANRDNPIRSMLGVLKFSSDGRLRLLDGKGWSVWSTDLAVKGSRATITNSGNFIMLGHGQNNSEIVWESFAHPTDTWLPGMKLWKGMKLTSWKSSVDPASGLFSLGMDMSPGKTQMLMLYNNIVPYWSSGEWTGNYFANVPEVYAPTRFEISCVRVSPFKIYFTFSISRQGHTLTGRILLDEKGELKSCDWMDDGTWTQAWSTYQGQCSKYDICGANGLCNANDVCSCAEGFKPKRDTQGWWSSGCSR